MRLEKLDGRTFFAAFEYGARLVEEKKNHLNSINFFPVPDNDTGTNMSSTLISTALKVQPTPSIDETFQSIARNIITTARGNSGLILAQFFSGLYRKMNNHKRINTREFAENMKQVIPYIYDNIEDPREGTMVTVIRDWAEKLPELASNIDDFVSLLESSLKTAHSSLERTREQLEINKKHNTVDAGAQGFVIFLEGIVKYLQGKTNDYNDLQPAAGKPGTEQRTGAVDLSQEEIDFRYCTEVLLAGDPDRQEIKTLIQDLGDSLIVVSNGELVKIHIHTDQPAEVVNRLRERGVIKEQKVDDMQRQQESAQKKGATTALVTDSIADIPRELMDKYSIHQIPLNILIDGVNYLDKLTVTADYFFDYLKEADEFPSSSQPTVDYVYNYLMNIADYYDSIIMISVSDQLSGTGWAFRSAQKKVQQEKNIDIYYVDSRLNSGAQGLLVLKAAEEIARGLKPQKLVEKIRKYRANTRIYVNVNTFDYMIKGGRVSPLKGRLANLLNLKPIVSLDEQGKGAIAGKAITGRGVRKKIIKKAQKMKEQTGIEKYALVHAEAENLASELAEEMIEVTGFESEYIMEISTIVALNAGPGAVGLSLLGGSE